MDPAMLSRADQNHAKWNAFLTQMVDDMRETRAERPDALDIELAGGLAQRINTVGIDPKAASTLLALAVVRLSKA